MLGKLKHQFPELLNKRKNRLLYFITHPIFLSIVISSIIIYFLPPIFNKYSAQVEDVNKNIKGRSIYYADLDDDGISEEILFDYINSDKFAIRVFKNGGIIDQWNFSGRIITTQGPFWYDVDGDGKKDLLLFVTRGNNIFLNCLSPLKNKILIHDRLISKYQAVGQRNYYGEVYPCGLFMDNRLGRKIFYFAINSGYSLYPRKLFAYDFIKDSLYQSGTSDAAIVNMLVYNSRHDINFITATSAVGNFKEEDHFSDRYSWLMDYNPNLDFKSNPIKIGFYPSLSDIKPFNPNNANYFVVKITYTGNNKFPSTLTIYNEELEKIKEREFNHSTQTQARDFLYYDIKNKPTYFFLIKENGVVEKYNKNLSVIDSINFPSFVDAYYALDVDGDGRDEIIYQTKDLENVLIGTNDFSNYVLVHCGDQGTIDHCSIKLNGENPPQLFIQFQNSAFLIDYGFNKLYYLKYLFYVGIYLSVFLFILLIQKTQKHRAELKFATEKKIAELQMRSIKNQIDPHFTLNIINSIGSLFYKRDREQADYIFGKYGKLLRQTILNSDKIVTTLGEEIEYVKNYLDLEKFRYSDKFTYNIKTDNVDLNFNIPKMLIHTFAENAIKHGIRHLEDKEGKLFIAETQSENKINIIIMDNGIGREKAKEIELGNTSKGFSIIQQILDLYYSLMKIKITYTIKDIYDENNNPTGTSVSIDIPLK